MSSMPSAIATALARGVRLRRRVLGRQAPALVSSARGSAVVVERRGVFADVRQPLGLLVAALRGECARQLGGDRGAVSRLAGFRHRLEALGQVPLRAGEIAGEQLDGRESLAGRLNGCECAADLLECRYVLPDQPARGGEVACIAWARARSVNSRL